jgi:hypothetical protein
VPVRTVMARDCLLLTGFHRPHRLSCLFGWVRTG